MQQSEKHDLKQLNGHLYDDFYVQELETRLETDPFTVGGMIDFEASGHADEIEPRCIVDQCEKVCGEYDSCFIDFCIVEK